MKFPRPLRWTRLRLSALASLFDRSDIPILLLILGVVLLGYGASRVHDGAGFPVVGILIILYARPLMRWVK